MNQTVPWLEIVLAVAALLGAVAGGALVLLGALVWLAGWRCLR